MKYNLRKKLDFYFYNNKKFIKILKYQFYIINQIFLMSLLGKKIIFNHYDHNVLMTSNPVKIGIYQKNDALISDLNIEIIEKNNLIINTINYYDKFDRLEMISIINRGLSYNEYKIFNNISKNFRRKKLWSLFAKIDILKNQTFKDFNFKVECKRKGPADIHISKDLNRTMPSHEYFSFNKNEVIF